MVPRTRENQAENDGCQGALLVQEVKQAEEFLSCAVEGSTDVISADQEDY